MTLVNPGTKPGNDRDRLAAGLSQMAIRFDEHQLDRLMAYGALLRKWNRTYNLVAAGDLENLVTRHLLDSLSILPFVLPGSLLDAGTGSGLPGLPLAVMNAGLECTLLDGAGKKIRFLRHVKRSLGIENIHPAESRVESFEHTGGFDNIVSRAFSSLAGFVQSTRQLAGPNTRLLAMKGRRPDVELATLPEGLKLESVEKLQVPDLHAERHLVIMSVSA